MSKAFLVMDMPSSCDKCPCFCGHYSDMCCMALNNRTINYPYPKDFRQRWCPLKELPEETHNNEYMDSVVKGSPFATAYFCRDLLPKDLIVEKMVTYERPLGE